MMSGRWAKLQEPWGWGSELFWALGERGAATQPWDRVGGSFWLWGLRWAEDSEPEVSEDEGCAGRHRVSSGPPSVLATDPHPRRALPPTLSPLPLLSPHLSSPALTCPLSHSDSFWLWSLKK